MTSQPDHYDVLRVDPAASQQEIARAYRALMRTRHPDLDTGAAAGNAAAGNAAGAGEPLRGGLLEIMHAYEVLRDPARRAAYDRGRTGTGMQGTSAGSGVQGSGPVVIPVRKVDRPDGPAGNTIRIMPVRWESGP